MKNKLKKIRNLLAISFLIAFISCEKDIYEDAINLSKLKKKTITFSEFKKNTNAYKSYTKVQKVKRDNFSKNLVLDSLTNFMLDMDKIIETTNGNLKSYTILIDDVTDPTKIKNLVFTENLNGKFNVFLTKYLLTDEERKRINSGEVLGLQSKKELFAWSSSMNISGHIYMDEDGNCYAIDEIWEQDGYVCWTIVYVPCTEGNGGTSSDSGDGSDSTDGGFWTPIPNSNSTGNNNSPTGGTASDGDGGGYTSDGFTLPLIGDPNPCVDLKEKSNQTVFKNKMAQLNSPASFALDHETGFVENRSNANLVSYNNATANPNTHTLSFPSSIKAVGYAHVHNDIIILNGKEHVSVKMLSPQDLQTFATTCQTDATSLGLTYSNTYGIMVSSEGTFALKMLTPTVDVSAIDFEEFTYDYTNKANELAADDNLNSTSLQKMFLKFLKAKGIDNNVGLYKATNSDLTQWSRVVLNSNGSPIEIPCN